MPVTVDELLQQAVGGNRAALATMLERCDAAVRRSLAGAIPKRWRALLTVDDVIQQTYTDAFLAIRALTARGEDAFRAWLLTLAKRNLVDALRTLEAEKRGGDRRALTPTGQAFDTLFELLAVTGSTPSGHAARSEACQALVRAIEQLPEIYRRVVRLYDLEGRPAREIAGVLQRSPGAVYLLRLRAHERLRVMLGTASDYLSG